MIKTRLFEDSNYKAIYCNGKTLRMPINPNLPVTELKYPEFYDIKVTGKCFGGCSYCYQDSIPAVDPYSNIVQKVVDYFSPMNSNQRPFQIAYGGGEPTSHPDFIKLLKATFDLGISPNYTTNGMHITDELIEATKLYCGGVALSCHPHLEKYWRKGIIRFTQEGIFVSLHIIISNKESVDRFVEIYNEYKDVVNYFVLLPYSSIGRGSEDETINYDYLFKNIPSDSTKIAFGANFYNALKTRNTKFQVGLYEPEIMSKYLDLKDMGLYPSSFSTKRLNSF